MSNSISVSRSLTAGLSVPVEVVVPGKYAVYATGVMAASSTAELEYDYGGSKSWEKFQGSTTLDTATLAASPAELQTYSVELPVGFYRVRFTAGSSSLGVDVTLKRVL